MKLKKTISLAAAILLAMTALAGCGGTTVLAATVADKEITVDQLTKRFSKQPELCLFLWI